MKPLFLLSLALSVIVFSGCGTSRPGAADYHHMRMLNAQGEVVTIDSRTGQVVPDRPERRSRDARRTAATLPPTPAEPEYWWRGDEVSGSPSISIRLGEQKAYFLKGGQVVGMAPISSGREGFRTPAGSFAITQKSRDHVSNLYGDYVDSAGNVVKANVGVHRHARPPGARFRGAPMPYFLRFNGAVGMHAGYLPGYPASHGCIRLPQEMARIFYHNVSVGTPVIVRH